MAFITWLNKIDGSDAGDPQKNVNAADMNQIKTAVNTNASDLDTAESILSSHVSNTTNPHAVTKAQVGLSNVDNTTDVGKPVSTAQQTALDLKANLASPTFTGNPAAPTQIAFDNSTKLSTTAYVDGAVVAAIIAFIGRIVTGELPTGTINGSNLVFTIANADPIRVAVYADGLRINPSSGYSVSGTTLTMVIPPDNSLRVDYIKAS